MIDYIFLKLAAGYVDTARLPKTATGGLYSQYTIAGKDGAKLIVREAHQTGEISIFGSIRKFWFGACATCDFNLAEFTDCLATLAHLLGITPIELGRAIVSKLEIGFSLFPTKAKPAEFIDNVCKDLPAKARLPEFTIYNNGASWHRPPHKDGLTKPKKQTIYNKGKQVQTEINKERKRAKLALCEAVPDCLRVEVRYNQRVSTQTSVKYLSDIAQNWNYLVRVWEQQAKYIDFAPPETEVDISGLKRESYLQAYYLLKQPDGFRRLCAKIRAEYSKNGASDKIKELRKLVSYLNDYASGKPSLKAHFCELIEAEAEAAKYSPSPEKWA